jgi:hypothetical protein
MTEVDDLTPLPGKMLWLSVFIGILLCGHSLGVARPSASSMFQ